jgi:hypothetical protein
MQMREPNGMDKPGIQPKYAPIPRGSEGQAGGRAGGAHWLSPENKQGGWLAGCCPSGPPSPNLLKNEEEGDRLRKDTCTPLPGATRTPATAPGYFFLLGFGQTRNKKGGRGGPYHYRLTARASPAKAKQVARHLRAPPAKLHQDHGRGKTGASPQKPCNTRAAGGARAQLPVARAWRLAGGQALVHLAVWDWGRIDSGPQHLRSAANTGTSLGAAHRGNTTQPLEWLGIRRCSPCRPLGPTGS